MDMDMARHKHHNPERRAWHGRSHKRGGKRIRQLRYSIGLYLEDLDDVAGLQVCCLRKLL